MAENGSEAYSQGFRTEVPTAFSLELTLPARGSQTVHLQVDQDFLLDALAAESTGPAVVRLRISDRPEPGAPTIRIPGETFQEYADGELPQHLAAQVGEDLQTWETKNAQLLQAALGGDDEAFFELLARDPRQLCSDLTLRRVLTWLTQIDRYNRFYHFKPDRFLASAGVLSEARQSMENARRKLARLGGSLLRRYDRRGKRPLPPPGVVRGVYYGLLCLLQGLRTFVAQCQREGLRPPPLEDRLSSMVAHLAGLHGDSPFLPYVALAAQLVRDPPVRERAGVTGTRLFDLVGPTWAQPSNTARQIAAAAFEVSEDTVERISTGSYVIPLPSSGDEVCVFVGRPNFALFDFPEVQALLAMADPLK